MFLTHGWIYHAEDYILTSGFRRIVIRMERLLPLGQWVYDKSRDSCDSSDYFPLVSGSSTNLVFKEKSIRFLSVC